MSFDLVCEFSPTGDQPKAIKQIVDGIEKGFDYQTLLGVTGSGKTFTMANVIKQVNRPALILAHNKTLAAQLYSEFSEFFPNNHVEYFVSYYDYYQPEAYVPHKDLYIEKDASINEYIEQMRLSATKSLLEYNDVIIIATVSAIYGIGEVSNYSSMVLKLFVNVELKYNFLISQLVKMQYNKSFEFKRGSFRVKGDTIDIFPSEHHEYGLRIVLFDDIVEYLYLFDVISGKITKRVKSFRLFPANHYVTSKSIIVEMISSIKVELASVIADYKKSGKILEANRIQQRTNFDIDLLRNTGTCKGIENYARYLSCKEAGEPPSTLLDYLPKKCLLFIDESHVTIPQIRAMYGGDRSRKMNLVEHGFRLPSALDNRPLMFEEFINKIPETIFVSATPSNYEINNSAQLVEQLIRPTGLLDPIIEVRAADTQINNLVTEISHNVHKSKGRSLVLTITKRMSEKVTEYLLEQGIKAAYLHSDIDTVMRFELIRDLRIGVIDVLVGVNLLREGIDIPEVNFLAVLDADKEGFLRSATSLIQMVGRAARNLDSLVVFYANNITPAMKCAMDETSRRREEQMIYNEKHNITPQAVKKTIKQLVDNQNVAEGDLAQDITKLSDSDLHKMMKIIKKKMKACSARLEFEQATIYRDKINKISAIMLQK